MLELYGPHVERTLGVLQRMAGYFHDDVREQAYDALAYLVAATAKAFPSLAPGKLISSAGALTTHLSSSGLFSSEMATRLSSGALFCPSDPINHVLVMECWCLTHMDCMQAR